MNAPDARSDRRDMDGEAGRGDMLGGLTTGAGSQLGLPDHLPDDNDGVMTFPVDVEQRTLEGSAQESDTSRQNLGASEPP
jgi:hypothetical protein